MQSVHLFLYIDRQCTHTCISNYYYSSTEWLLYAVVQHGL